MPTLEGPHCMLQKLRFLATKRAIEAPLSILDRYRQFQSQHPNHLVLMQVGDFFEIYGESVPTAARILEIAATKAPGREPVAMTGFPVRSFETYLGKLIKAGQSVVIAEQVPIPHSARFDRQITRIVTPGTVLEEHLLDSNLNNYIVLIAADGSLAWMDVSTGDFWASQSKDTDEMMDMLARLKPREILISESAFSHLEFYCSKHGILLRQVDNLPSDSSVEVDESFTPSASELQTAKQLATFVRQNTLLSLHLKPLRRFISRQENMNIDAQSFRALDVMVNSVDGGDSGSLLGTLNECKTALGSRMLRRRLQAPMTGVEAIQRALDGVERFANATADFLTELRKQLVTISDLDRILQRLLLQRPQGVARDLRSLSRSIRDGQRALQFCQMTSEFSHNLTLAIDKIIAFINEDKVPLRDADGGFIRPGVDAELDELRRLEQDSSSVFSPLEAAYRQQTGIPNLKIASFKGDQHVIEVPKSALPLISPHTSKQSPNLFILTFLDFKPLMQTEVKARFITDELVNKSFLLRSVNERTIERELIILDGLRAPILASVDEIRRFSECIAELDLNSTLGYLAQRYHFIRPQIIHSPNHPVLQIQNGRHPILDCKFQSSHPPIHFTPNSLQLHSDSKKAIFICFMLISCRQVCLVNGP